MGQAFQLWTLRLCAEIYPEHGQNIRAKNIKACHLAVRHGLDAWEHGTRHAVRQELALSILCLHCLGHTLSFVEIWPRSHLGIGKLGYARARMAEIPKH